MYTPELNIKMLVSLFLHLHKLLSFFHLANWIDKEISFFLIIEGEYFSCLWSQLLFWTNVFLILLIRKPKIRKSNLCRTPQQDRARILN